MNESNQPNAIETQKETLRLAYCKASEAAQAAIKVLVGNVFGKVEVTTPVECEDRGFECAAWNETRVSGTGVFDVTLRQDPHNKNRIFFAAEMPATILRDFFPSLFCGNMVGQPYDTAKNAGNPARPVIIVKEPVEAVMKSSASEGEKGQKWAILPETYRALAECYRAQHAAAVAYQAYANFVFQTEDDDQFLSKIGQTAYAGERVADAARAVVEITRTLGFHEGRGTNYFAKNNPFAVAA